MHKKVIMEKILNSIKNIFIYVMTSLISLNVLLTVSHKSVYLDGFFDTISLKATLIFIGLDNAEILVLISSFCGSLVTIG